MTSRERILRAARRMEVDTIPITPRLGYASTYHLRRNDTIAHLALKRIYDYDPQIIITANHYPFFDPFATFKDRDRVGVEIEIVDEERTKKVQKRYTTPAGELTESYLVPKPGHPEFGETPNPVHLEHLVKERADLELLAFLMPESDPDFAHQIRTAELVVGDEGLVLATVYGALDHQAGSVMALEEIMVELYEEPDFVTELISMFQRQIIAQTRLLLEHGVRNFFCPYYYHSLSAGWSPDHFRNLSFPLIKEQAGLIHEYDGLVFYYDDGKHMRIIPDLIEAGVDVVETCTPPPVGDFDLGEAKRLYGGSITFKGYIDLIYVLQRGSVEEVREAVRFACETGGKAGGFILGTSDSMRAGTPIENINAYFEAGREYGSR